MSAITYTVVKTIEEKIGNEKRKVTATIVKTMKLSLHLSKMTETFVVFYPIWDGKHMTNLVAAEHPFREIDDISRKHIAKILRDLS